MISFREFHNRMDLQYTWIPWQKIFVSMNLKGPRIIENFLLLTGLKDRCYSKSEDKEFLLTNEKLLKSV